MGADGRSTTGPVRTPAPANSTREIRPAARPRRNAAARRNLRNGLLFLAPWLIGLVVLQAYPFLMTAYYAFTDFDGLNFPPHWIGLQNFSTLFTADPQFWPSILNTLWWVVTSVPMSIVFGVLLAMLLNRRVRGLGFFRTAFYLPSMVPFVGGSVLFLWLFNPGGGAINSLLDGIGITGPGWFADPAWAKPTLLLLSLWQIGPAMIIFLAGLQDIPAELYEAASIDGASALQRFRYVTLPLLTPAIFFNLVLGTIWSFSYFTQALVVSAAPASLGGAHAPGGPADATLFYSLYLYTQIFQNFRLGYGAAMSLLLTVVVIVLAALLFRTGRRWVFYYDHQA